MFGILAAVILAAAVFCVTTKRIMRAATALLFVLFGVAGLYFLLDYTFLGATQISIYAGGITIGFATVAWIIFKHRFADMAASVADKEVGMDVIGKTLMGADKYQYVLPFEFISLFLLACIIGGLVILNDKKEEKKQ